MFEFRSFRLALPCNLRSGYQRVRLRQGAQNGTAESPKPKPLNRGVTRRPLPHCKPQHGHGEETFTSED